MILYCAQLEVQPSGYFSSSHEFKMSWQEGLCKCLWGSRLLCRHLNILGGTLFSYLEQWVIILKLSSWWQVNQVAPSTTSLRQGSILILLWTGSLRLTVIGLWVCETRIRASRTAASHRGVWVCFSASPLLDTAKPNRRPGGREEPGSAWMENLWELLRVVLFPGRRQSFLSSGWKGFQGLRRLL